MNMKMDGRVYRVLIASSSERFAESVTKLLPEYAYHPVQVTTCASQAKRALLENHFDFVIINAPLSDEQGTRLAIDAVADNGTVCLLITPAASFSGINQQMVENGVFVLARPVTVEILNTALNWMAAFCERLQKQAKKVVTLEEKMDEIRLINRAKWALIENLKMNEEDAHHYIERQAMNRGVTKRQIAESIIRTYL